MLGKRAFRFSRIVSSAPVGAALLCAACAPSHPTEIVTGVSTQIRVPEDLEAVAISIRAEGKQLFCDEYPVEGGRAQLPATLGLVETARISEVGPVTITVVGERDATVEFCGMPQLPKNSFVLRSRKLTFVDQEIKYLPIPLKESCADVQCDEEKETCIAGRCVKMDVDATKLQPYSDSLIFGNTNTCFDAERCMSQQVTLPVINEDPENCTFRLALPEGSEVDDPSQVNVRVYYKTLGSEILDLDASDSEADQQEGFSLAKGAKSASFSLAPGLCEAVYKKDKLLSMEASIGCPAKRALQPLCDSYSAPQLFDSELFNDGTSGKGGKGNNGKADEDTRICTIAGLQAVDSAVYVLMDNGTSMGQFFGEGGLRFAVEVPLHSPVAKHTQVAFGLLPAADRCNVTPNNWATETKPVEAIRDEIGEILGNVGSVRSDDPPLYLEAALKVAYSKLLEAKPGSGEIFHRRAAVVISNRDTLLDECRDADAVTLAATRSAKTTAASERVFTYAVALGNDLDDDAANAAQGKAALSSAKQLASAGGTSVYDGRKEEDGLTAVNKILTELGTCLYKVNRLDTASDPLPESTQITYIDPSSLEKQAVAIKHNSECRDPLELTDKDEGSDWGWNYDGEYLRLCGSDCDSLRQAIGDMTEAQFAAGAAAAPAVPLVAAAPCRDFQKQ